MTDTCPDKGLGQDNLTCWTSYGDEPVDETINIIDWLKSEMMDGLDHEYAHSVLGPFIFGYTDGVPNFLVQRNVNNKRWEVVGKPEWSADNAKGIVDERAK